jgi:Ca2+/Na+ antiporter
VFLLFVSNNYSIYFVTDSDFRDALIFALKNNSIVFEERMNRIELVELKNTLKVMYYFIYGMVGIKNRKDKEILRKIIKDIKAYFKGNKIKSKKTGAIYFLAIGILMTFSIIFLTYFINNIDKFFSIEA